MSTKVRYKDFGQPTFEDLLIYSQLPPHPFWSNLETKIDFSFADDLCAVLYSGRGQRPYAPSLKLKIHLVQAYENLTDRQTELKIMSDMFIKRFLRLPIAFFGFDHSTIGLDRDRMGSFMFEACHLYILAQMHKLGLWGDKDEQWIIDSFPSQARIPYTGAYRLIQKSMIRLMQHLKRTNRPLYDLACKEVVLDAMTFRLPAGSNQKDWIAAFSKLVVQAYGLLSWFERAPQFWEWKQKKAQLKSLELQALLFQILTENTRPHNPDPQKKSKPQDAGDSAPSSNSDSGLTEYSETLEVTSDPPIAGQGGAPVEEPPKYEKIPRNERPSHRIISAYDTDARSGPKNRFLVINGYKTQNLCTTQGVVLETKAIPASEHDSEAMVEMVKGIQSFFDITPKAVLGDTAYGLGKQRIALKEFQIEVIAPVPPTNNPTGRYSNEHFLYDADRDVYICPQKKETVKKINLPVYEGKQYHFDKKDCNVCPFRSECTTSKAGRTIFRSDYADEYEKARAFIESEQGKAELRKRKRVERVNNELKNYCGLGRPQTRGLMALNIKAKLAGIITNLKLTVRRLCDPKPGVLRRTKKPMEVVRC